MMEKKIDELLKRLHVLEEQLGTPEIVNDQKNYRSLTQEHSYLSELRHSWEELVKAKDHLRDNTALLKNETDADFIQMLEADSEGLKQKIEVLEKKVEELLIPPDPDDNCNTIMELRAGTGGDEAALFVGDCARMYKIFADIQGWTYELISCSPSEVGGYKEYIMAISGNNVYRLLRYEGGTHRVQRVPDTETQGRVHTSAITIAVLREADEEVDIKIDEKDLRIDTYRSSGAGGQHVNTTDSAVRITHIPTGVAVYCQQERSQHKNREKAMRLLKAKLAEEERLKREKEMASSRASQVGSGDRSERIRTYNFPQNRVTDHRINLTLYKLDRMMQGDLDELTSALISHNHKLKLGEV
jgi:peptide chain release factor 1